MGEERKERPPRDRFAIEEELLRRVQAARASLQRAMEEFRRVLERSDGAERALHLKEAEQAHRNAIDAYRNALKQFNDFIIDRKVPDDL